MSAINWLAVAGLAIEIVGLLFLFWDLSRTKLAESSELASQEADDQLASSTRSAVALIFQHVQTNSKMYTHLLDEGMPFEQIPGGKAAIVAALRSAQDQLYGLDYPRKMRDAEALASAARTANAESRAVFLRKLRRSAMAGIALVLFGATLQLTAMFVFVGSW